MDVDASGDAMDVDAIDTDAMASSSISRNRNLRTLCMGICLHCEHMQECM
jgi:hypothetical protein